MNILKFAKINGVTFVRCGPGWGGPIGYKEEKYPNSTMCGYKTKTEAAEAWMQDLGLSEAGIEALRNALEKVK